MLTHLAIKQFTLVENLELDIAQGFTVITGKQVLVSLFYWMLWAYV